MTRPTTMATSDDTTADTETRTFAGKGERSAWPTFAVANRHDPVTHAPKTGKTVTRQIRAEGVARTGVAVLTADIRGDLRGFRKSARSRTLSSSAPAKLGSCSSPSSFPQLSIDQFIARNLARSVTDEMAVAMVADIGKSVGGSIAGSIGRALVRGALGGFAASMNSDLRLKVA